MMNIYHACMTRILEVISPQPMPLLASIDLGSCGAKVEFEQQLFPSGVAGLTSATIYDADISTIHFCLPAFQSLTSLQLRGELNISVDDNGLNYRSFRDALIAPPALRHLDLSIGIFTAMASRLPILLPSVQHLQVEGCSEAVPYRYLDNLLRCIQAPYLVALSLSTWNAEPLLRLAHTYERHFPSLQHLVLADIARDSVGDLMMFARAFPCIQRLTFKPGFYSSTFLHKILGGFIGGEGDTIQNSAQSERLWPKLHSIAMSTSKEHLDVTSLNNTILKLQAAGHPIRKLMLPQEVHPAMVEMRGSVELEDFYVDWPTPFDW
ncbi:hypothetical protein FIBSPDRAFT_927266 [Athelia psychrophila]|uniref:F-box domain-containing protein n=1 Tax=Athelia psychrophila TaxID=1759441 RepID=A0A166RZM1_9AGAM|nr:hypothetical protein FIBSPDRAFT_927266 [Fibularhizoctonia sp. CBS 109695]